MLRGSASVIQYTYNLIYCHSATGFIGFVACGLRDYLEKLIRNGKKDGGGGADPTEKCQDSATIQSQL